MLKKENRLNSPKAYRATYINNVTVSDNLMVIYAGKIKTNNDYPARVGFIVSKKIHKRAVKRNRIKRLMRENIRLLFKGSEKDKIDNFQSLIFVAKYGILNKSFNEIQNSCLILLNKLANKNI